MKELAVLTAVLFGSFLGGDSFASMVDSESYDRFVRSELKVVVDKVLREDKCPVSRPFVADYDQNKDGFIDKTEVKAIQDFLANQTAP